MSDRKKVEVCFTPDEYDYFKGNFEIVVVIDVLRATSTICSAFAQGVSAVIPVASVEEAFEYQKKGYLIGGERNGKKIDGFDFSNSPFSFQKINTENLEIVLTTTNGTRALDIAKEAEKVVIGSFLNLDYLTTWLIEQNKNVLCLCSGWHGRFNLEDSICAGAIAEALLLSGKYTSDEDSSVGAKYLFDSAKRSYFGFLKMSSHRRRLKNMNLNEDVKYCLTPNLIPVIPYLNAGKLIKLDI